MRAPFVGASVLAILFSLSAVPALQAADRQVPVAPPEFLEMETPIDMDDVDDAFFKRTRRVYKSKCKKCHGTEGDGQGSASADIQIKPTPFNGPGYLESRKDGQLFWMLAKGSKGTEMNGFGPGTDAGLSEEELWKLVAYLRFKFSK